MLSPGSSAFGVSKMLSAGRTLPYSSAAAERAAGAVNKHQQQHAVGHSAMCRRRDLSPRMIGMFILSESSTCALSHRWR